MFQRLRGRDVRAAFLVPFSVSLVLASLADNSKAEPAGDSARKTEASPRRVTRAWIGEPVVDLLRELSLPGEPRLTAAPVLGERRVNVFVKELPESKLRQALADIVSGVWVRRERGTQLHLEPDPAADRERGAAIAERKARFFQGLRSLIRDLSLDADGRKQLEKSEPAAAGYLSNPASRAAIQLSALLTRQQWQELETGGRLTLTPEQLGPQGPAMLREFARLINEQQAEFRKSITDDPLEADPPLDVEQVSQRPLQFWVDGLTLGPSRMPYSHLHVMVGDWPVGQPGARASSMVITGSQAATTPGPRWGDPAASTVTAIKPPTVTVTFKHPPTDWGSVLRTISEALKFQAVSEEFTRQFPRTLELGSGGQLDGTLPQILDRVCELYGYQWRLKDGVYQFRSAAWYVDREQEPPGTLVKAARTAREQRKSLGLEWLAHASRTGGQGPSNLLWVYAPAAMPVMMRYQPLLQFYGSLSPTQREALESERGLSGDALSDGQRALLLQSVQHLSRGEPVGPGPQPLVRLVQSATSAAFTIQLGERSIDATVPFPSAQPGGGLPGFGLGPPPAQ